MTTMLEFPNPSAWEPTHRDCCCQYPTLHPDTVELVVFDFDGRPCMSAEVPSDEDLGEWSAWMLQRARDRHTARQKEDDELQKSFSLSLHAARRLEESMSEAERENLGNREAQRFREEREAYQKLELIELSYQTEKREPNPFTLKEIS